MLLNALLATLTAPPAPMPMLNPPTAPRNTIRLGALGGGSDDLLLLGEDPLAVGVCLLGA